MTLSFIRYVNSKIFLISNFQVTYMNGARIGETISCGNGLIHMIDIMPLTSKPEVRTISQYIYNSPTGSQFT